MAGDSKLLSQHKEWDHLTLRVSLWNITQLVQLNFNSLKAIPEGASFTPAFKPIFGTMTIRSTDAGTEYGEPSMVGVYQTCRGFSKLQTAWHLAADPRGTICYSKEETKQLPGRRYGGREGMARPGTGSDRLYIISGKTVRTIHGLNIHGGSHFSETEGLACLGHPSYPGGMPMAPGYI